MNKNDDLLEIIILQEKQKKFFILEVISGILGIAIVLSTMILSEETLQSIILGGIGVLFIILSSVFTIISANYSIKCRKLIKEYLNS